ncbi:MAG: glycosyltransferase family 2 protein [Psychroflexus halocasei]
MSQEPLVSIIIPTYNRAHLIGETLDSVLAQTYQNWECIVVDDGSTDDTDSVMKGYCDKDSRFKYYHRPDEHLPGGNGARNYGFKMSRGEYIQWFDSDDLMFDIFLSYKIKNISSNDIIITSGEIIEKGDSIRKLRFDFTHNYSLYKEMVLYKSEIITPCILFKKEKLLKTSLFNEDIIRGQESEFFARFFYSYPNLKHSTYNKSLFQYRINSDSKSFKNKISYLPSRLIFYINNFERGLILNDIELINRFYKKIIAALFDLIKHKQRGDFDLYYNLFLDLIQKHSFKIKFSSVLPQLNKFGIHSEKLRKYFINQY